MGLIPGMSSCHSRRQARIFDPCGGLERRHGGGGWLLHGEVVDGVATETASTQGDGQTGAPGAQLAQTLRVQLTDSSGTPVIGIPVTFAASTGGQIVSASAATDNSGQASAAVRLPPSEGLALFTATAARLVATFSARAAATR